jgi:hypothetical protein
MARRHAGRRDDQPKRIAAETFGSGALDDVGLKRAAGVAGAARMARAAARSFLRVETS